MSKPESFEIPALSDEESWWAHQYAEHAAGRPVAEHAKGWIARWPQFVRCEGCAKALGADGARRSRHRCKNGDIR